MSKGKKLLQLFLVFLKIGAFTFGGGYAMISIIENNCVERRKWITHDDMMNVTVIAESTPGPIAINCATFVGYMQAGLLGSIVATLGVVLPSFIIIYVISLFLNNFLEYTIVARAFAGIKIAVGILIFDAAYKMIKKMKKDALSLVILIVSAVVMLLINIFGWNFSSIILMIISAVISLVLFAVRQKKVKEGEK